MLTNEKELYSLWESFCREGGQTRDNRLTGIDAGQANRFEGPDYQGAEFELDGKIYRGDVEIHVRTGDWYAHHHHLDRRYTQVQLHLVWEMDQDLCIRNSLNRSVPTLSLRSFPRYPDSGDYRGQCKWHSKEPIDCRQRLQEMALQRLLSKHRTIRQLCAANSFDQVIYLLLLRILGQPHNENNFILLGNRLPWEAITQIKDKRPLTATHWLALLAHVSGLINRFPFFRHLKALQPQIEALYNGPVLQATGLHWQLAGQRPRNNPVYHLMVLADWLASLPVCSLYHSLKKILICRLPNREAIKSVEDFFSPLQSAFSRTAPSQCRSWGREKLTEIIGNVILPFFHREAVCQASLGFKAYLESLFYALPQRQGYARLNFFYELLGLRTMRFNRFFCNQGLIFLQDHYCQSAGCQFCPLEIKFKYVDKNFENL